MKKVGNNKTFIRITNQQIYDELNSLKENNEKEHIAIMNMISGYKSQMRRVYWLLGILTSVTVGLITYFINHIGGAK
jgi:hypothetical protein